MAASLVTMLPVVIVFIIGQKYFVQGLTLGGLKG
jgi:multiple sugar transport system permease protein